MGELSEFITECTSAFMGELMGEFIGFLLDKFMGEFMGGCIHIYVCVCG